MTTNKQGDQNVYLIVDKEDLSKKIYDRLQTGDLLVLRKIASQIEKKEWWENFIDWDTYNIELIKQAFDKPDNSYVFDYKRKSGIDVAFFGGSYKKPSFMEDVESCRGEMRFQVRKLKWFYEKIELLKSSDLVSKGDNRKVKFNQLINLLTRFHKFAQELRDRRQGRETVIIKDEYDVQDLLFSLLHLHFDDIRKEEFSPSNSGANSRLDFVLKKEKIILEVKMSSERLGSKELGEELLIDIGRYKEYPDCTDLVIFIYDKADHIRNKKGLINDLQKQSRPELSVTVIINPD
jgi:hypothetical protein